MLTLSIIIPVYNEERHIQACLDAIAAQSHAPTEVIIVNNNCTDRTLELAETYDFVKIVHESQQGRGHARNAGFNAARGDIIGRIDADTRIHPDWAARVIETFTKDSELMGLTGIACAPFVPYVLRFKNTLFSRSYYWFAHAAFNTITMWGANMAVRRTAWEKVKTVVCLDDSLVHEDQDVSLWMAANGSKIMQDNSLVMTTDEDSYHYLPKIIQYYRLYKGTKKLHTENGNLASSKLRKIGFWRTLPGRMLAMVSGLYLVLFCSLLFFPIDYVVLHGPWKAKSIH